MLLSSLDNTSTENSLNAIFFHKFAFGENFLIHLVFNKTNLTRLQGNNTMKPIYAYYF